MRLLPRREVAAFVELVVMDQLGIRLFRPTPRCWIELVREDTHGYRDGDAFGIEIPELAPILPIEPGTRERRVRQPGDCDVVKDVVACQAFGCSRKNVCDQLVAARVVIQEISCQTDG